MFKFIKAVGKYAARFVNDSAYNRDYKKTQNRAYEITGKRLAKSKHYVGKKKCKQWYQNELKHQRTLVNQKHDRRDKFIGDF